jgi:hypothetical protein
LNDDQIGESWIDQIDSSDSWCQYIGSINNRRSPASSTTRFFEEFEQELGRQRTSAHSKTRKNPRTESRRARGCNVYDGGLSYAVIMTWNDITIFIAWIRTREIQGPKGRFGIFQEIVGGRNGVCIARKNI